VTERYLVVTFHSKEPFEEFWNENKALNRFTSLREKGIEAELFRETYDEYDEFLKYERIS